MSVDKLPLTPILCLPTHHGHSHMNVSALIVA